MIPETEHLLLFRSLFKSRKDVFAVRWEKYIADFLGTEDTILYAAAFDANGGVFEPLFNEQDAIISDELNHAYIIAGGCNKHDFRPGGNRFFGLPLPARLKHYS